MVVMTCTCGATSMRFQKLNLEDFSNGWVAECCSEGKANVLKDVETFETNTTASQAKPLETHEFKKRGRKGK